MTVALHFKPLLLNIRGLEGDITASGDDGILLLGKQLIFIVEREREREIKRHSHKSSKSLHFVWSRADEHKGDASSCIIISHGVHCPEIALELSLDAFVTRGSPKWFGRLSWQPLCQVQSGQWFRTLESARLAKGTLQLDWGPLWFLPGSLAILPWLWTPPATTTSPPLSLEQGLLFNQGSGGPLGTNSSGAG